MILNSVDSAWHMSYFWQLPYSEYQEQQGQGGKQDDDKKVS